MDFLRRRLVGALASIKLRVTLSAIAAVAAGVLLTAVLLVQRAEQDTLTHHRDRELAEAVHTAGLLSERVVERQRALRSSSEQIDPALLNDAARLKHLFDDKPLLRSLFANVFAASADGRVMVYVDEGGVRHPDVNIADRDYFRRALRDQRPVISEPVPGRVSGEPVIVFAHPLVRNGVVFGVIGGSLRLASRDLLGDVAGAFDGMERSLVVVTDAQGHLLAHPMRRNLLHSVAGEQRLVEAHAHWVASGSPVEPAGLMLHQPGEVVSVAGVAGPDWVVWRAVPEGELLRPLHAARREALFAAAGLVALLSLLILAIVSRLLRPLGELTERAQHLFDGSLDLHDGWPNASGEIRRLSRVLRHVGAERAQLESFNAQVLRKLSSVMAAAPVGICFTRDRRFELVSEEFCRLFGRSEADLLGQPTSCIYASNEDYLTLSPQVVAEFKQGRAYMGEWQMLRADGSCFWGQLRGRPVAEGDPAAGTIWTIADISEQVAQREQLEWSATHDALTGLANRKLFAQRLERVLEASPRSMPAEVVMIDLDHFKPVNDRAGHAAGDAMLKAVAAVITSRVRATDLVARLGGDEFALLLERCPHETALRIAESVREAISAIVLHREGHELRIGACLGVASLREETASAADWLAEADTACYAAKAAGRGSVQAAKRPALRIVG